MEVAAAGAAAGAIEVGADGFLAACFFGAAGGFALIACLSGCLLEADKPDIAIDVPKDYKFFTFNGKVHIIQVDGERFSGHRRSLYDPDWRDTGVRTGILALSANL